MGNALAVRLAPIASPYGQGEGIGGAAMGRARRLCSAQLGARVVNGFGIESNNARQCGAIAAPKQEVIGAAGQVYASPAD